MGLSEAIAAAQTAGNSTAEQIHTWLFGATADRVDSGATIGHSQIVELLGLSATALLLAGLEAASATNGVAKTVLTLLTTGGHVKTGTTSIQASLADFVTAGLLSQQQATTLMSAGMRPVYRYETFGLHALPTLKKIREAM